VLAAMWRRGAGLAARVVAVFDTVAVGMKMTPCEPDAPAQPPEPPAEWSVRLPLACGTGGTPVPPTRASKRDEPAGA